jgi:hypothetical protein
MNFETVKPFFQPISRSELDTLERTTNQARVPLAVGLDEVGMTGLAQQVLSDSCAVKERQPGWPHVKRQG